MSADRISTISYGKEKPLDPGHNEEAWGKIVEVTSSSYRNRKRMGRKIGRLRKEGPC